MQQVYFSHRSVVVAIKDKRVYKIPIPWRGGYLESHVLLRQSVRMYVNYQNYLGQGDTCVALAEGVSFITEGKLPVCN